MIIRVAKKIINKKVQMCEGLKDGRGGGKAGWEMGTRKEMMR